MTGLHRYSALSTLLICLLAVACAPTPTLPPGENIQLASFTDSINHVAVSVRLSRPSNGTFLLVATFTPPSGYHLYSKDLPRAGVRGQGRPTLIELAAGAKMQPAGALTESVAASVPGYVPDGAPVYPSGPVTLTLPVKLPDQTGWVDDWISLTYMDCTQVQCLPPTVGKLVQVKIPGAGSVTK